MQDFFTAYYLWIQAFHLIAVMSWMAGLLYLPRIFVYHAQEEIGSAASETFKTMERKLLRYIMRPAMILTWVMGILMIVAYPSIFDSGWIHAKLTLVVILTAYHHMLLVWVKRFARDGNTKNHVFYRWMNEVPTVLMVGIVILAVVKPF